MISTWLPPSEVVRLSEHSISPVAVFTLAPRRVPLLVEKSMGRGVFWTGVCPKQLSQMGTISGTVLWISEAARSFSYKKMGLCRKGFFLLCIGESKGGARDARPAGGPNSFIFMQFSAKNLKNNSTFGSWRTPSGKSWIRLCFAMMIVFCCTFFVQLKLLTESM